MSEPDGEGKTFAHTGNRTEVVQSIANRSTDTNIRDQIENGKEGTKDHLSCTFQNQLDFARRLDCGRLKMKHKTVFSRDVIIMSHELVETVNNIKSGTKAFRVQRGNEEGL
ncbi:hypothetical protein L798_01736 [Zootermopsis nevadensis]|uniref:Uncharacterized protein n=1 Tax=Zootermopsis nevadensis TaxID=136037 RepID=A0A067RCW2_ZOONE|nr:hypothetical protein L798_01736 [Zootermopsis nevadensis]